MAELYYKRAYFKIYFQDKFLFSVDKMSNKTEIYLGAKSLLILNVH